MFQSDLLRNKVIVITGGGSGIGFGIAEAITKYGGKVALMGRREEVLKDAVNILGHENSFGLSCDVRFPDSVNEALDRILEHFGKVDGLINNAAGNFVAPTKNLKPTAFKLIVDTVLMGSIYCSLAFGKHWIEAGQKGTVICISTNYASTGSPYVVPSGCAKAGVENLVTSLASEWGRYGIRFLGISPGPFPTEGAVRQLRFFEQGCLPGVDMNDLVISRIPLGRIGKIEELAHLAVYLLSPMGDYINGTIIRIDGGELPNISGEFSYLHNAEDSFWIQNGSSLNRNKK